MKQNGNRLLKIKFNSLKQAVFLDRDGVINQAIVKDGKPYSPINLKKFKILPGVKKAMEALKASGWLLIVVTNQPDVARGKAKQVDIELIHKYLQEQIPIEAIYTCYHDNNDGCDCRKPSPGAFFKAKKIYKINLKKSFMIGDRWSDIEAGRKAGCKTIFIDYNYNEKKIKNFDYKANSLSDATRIILKLKKYDKIRKFKS